MTWISEADEGRYAAMNKAAARATGDLLWFMHAGDQFLDARSVELVSLSAIKDGWDWAYGFSQIDRNGKTIGFQGRMPFKVKKFSLGGHPVPHQASIFRRKFFFELGGYNTNFGLSADQQFMLKAAMVRNPTVIPAFLCNFDGSGAGSTSQLGITTTICGVLGNHYSIRRLALWESIPC